MRGGREAERGGGERDREGEKIEMYPGCGWWNTSVNIRVQSKHSKISTEILNSCHTNTYGKV